MQYTYFTSVFYPNEVKYSVSDLLYRLQNQNCYKFSYVEFPISDTSVIFGTYAQMPIH